MNIWMYLLLSNVTLCYAGTGIFYFMQKDVDRGLFWCSYSLANFTYMRFSS